MDLTTADTALVVTDPQNDVLRAGNPVWPLVGPALAAHRTVENLHRLFRTAGENGFGVFVSPHCNFTADLAWRFGGPIERTVHEAGMLARPSTLTLDGFPGSGADWLPELAPFVEDGRTVVTSPHEIFGPQTNDLVLQLRKRGVTQVVLAGMLANLCVEPHLRDLLKNGFRCAVVSDAVAAPDHPEFGDGNVAAAVNHRFLTDDVLTTDQVVEQFTRTPRRTP